MQVIRGIVAFIRHMFGRAVRQRPALPVQLALLVEQLPGCLAMFDADMRFLAASPRFLSEMEALFSGKRRSTAGVIGRSLYEIFPDVPAQWRQLHARALAGDAVDEHRDLVTRDAGGTVRARWSVKPWRNANGRIGGVLLSGEVIAAPVAADTAFSRTETLFRATFENTAVGIAHLGRDGGFVGANQALCRILGWPKDELLNKSVRDLSHPDDYAVDYAHLTRLRAGEIDGYTMDKRYLRKDGAIVWGQLTVSCLHGSDGSIDHYIAIVEDISSRKRAEETLQHQADLLDQSHDAIVELRTGDRIIVYWNRGAERLYGHTAAEAMGRSMDDLVQTRAAIPVQDIDAHVLEAGIWTGELTHRTRDGRDIVVESRIVPVWYGGEMFQLETNRDITARRHAEDARRDSEERLRAIYDGTYEYIGLLSLDGTLLDANRAALEFAGDAFGSSREHVVGRPFWETVWFVRTPGAPEKMRNAIARAAAGEFIRYEASLVRPSGEPVTFDISLHPVRNKHGEVFLIVPEGRIITDRKRAEQELAKSEERFRASILHSPLPTMLFDDREDILAVSRSWVRAAGVVSASRFRRLEDLTAFLFGERSGEMLELVRTIIATEPEAQTGEHVVTVGSERRIWSFTTSSLGLQSDGRRLFVCVAQDATDQRAYEERIDLLMREARHRIKNILGLVQAIVRQTASKDADDLIDRFTRRIHALAANQDLLVQHAWQRIDVKELVQSQLGHFADAIDSRIVVVGPKLLLNAAAAQAIGLALHELATNAGKYGALSTDAGRVDVNWQLDDDRFVMGWRERGGPPVRPPVHRGFGTTVIETMAEQTLGGEVRLDYSPSGLEWHLICRAADALEVPADGHQPPPRELPPQRSMTGNAGARAAHGMRPRDAAPEKAVTAAALGRPPDEDLKLMRTAIAMEERKLLAAVLEEPLPAEMADLVKRIDQAGTDPGGSDSA